MVDFNAAEEVLRMTQTQVVNLMRSSRSEREWNENCGRVKAACGGYPDFWYATIIQGGILVRAKTEFGW